MIRSLNEMVRQIFGLADTKDVTEWESEFIKSVHYKSIKGYDTTRLSEKQIEIIERIWKKHFA